MTSPSRVVVVNRNPATAFLLPLWLQRAHLAEQVLTAASMDEVLALLSHPDGAAPLPPCLLLVELHQPIGRDGRPCQPVLPNVPVVATHHAPIPLFLLEQLQQLPLAGLIELPLTEQGVAFLRRLRVLPGSTCQPTGELP
ncbi:hypothetical protein DNI29_22390 [Hymenobacter sediminis]|uniref:hypothetical protein n=1 Tax=Hymenobacter sediminis TaxID=2218621 RepID=UPI000DA6D54A|nr:hypothetical protein [Hymenobacter sediminis]RPD44148.1 hypothetical protein DNI29_22390 [Hymenobacter sediminis]